MSRQPIMLARARQVSFSERTAPAGTDTSSISSSSLLLKEHSEVYTHDDDGNLTSDGRWTYTWDADGARQREDGAPKARPKGRLSRVPSGRIRQQNRLCRMETASLAYTAGAPRKRIDYAYDDRGRRTLKSVFSWNTGTSAFNTTPAAKVGFLYHGWNLLQEVDLSGSTPATLRSYYWGLDMSGTLQGAGGVGGLLAADLDHSLTTYNSVFYASDANGNVSDLAWSHGGFVAHYEYDAFGNAFPEGYLATSNPFRFSTKYTETDAATGGNETGLLYYGFRYYNPSTGRWPSRDPIGINGGMNLYGMLGNDSLNKADILGLFWSLAGALEVPPACCEEEIWFDDFGAIENFSLKESKFSGIEPVFLPRDGETFWETYKRTTKPTRAHIWNILYEINISLDIQLKCKKRNRNCKTEEKVILSKGINLANLSFSIPIYDTWGGSVPIPAVQAISKINVASQLAKIGSSSPEIMAAITAAIGGEAELDALCEKAFQ